MIGPPGWEPPLGQPFWITLAVAAALRTDWLHVGTYDKWSACDDRDCVGRYQRTLLPRI